MEKNCNTIDGKLPLPSGDSDWATFSQNSYCVDKTLLVKELIDYSIQHISLFVRPHRFGKTAAMQMVKAFFEKTDEDTSHLFVDKKIWSAGDKYRERQGKYPVIHVSFADHTATSWDEAHAQLTRTLSAEIMRHREIFDHDDGKYRSIALEQLKKVMDGTAEKWQLKDVLKDLSERLHKLYNARAVILVDEYDKPLLQAELNGYGEEMHSFMEMMLGIALKGNDHCELGLMTGRCRIVPKGIGSGFNNYSTYSMFDWKASEYFGFTEDEVRDMAAYYGVPEKVDEILQWYGGYDVDGTMVCNPCSVLRYFANGCAPGEYWTETLEDDFVLKSIKRNSEMFEEVIEELEKENKRDKRGKVLVSLHHAGMMSSDTMHEPYMLPSLLVLSGLLTVPSLSHKDNEYGFCFADLPNEEVRRYFRRLVEMVRKQGGFPGNLR